MVSIISTWVSRPIVRRVLHFFIVSRLSRKYDENKYQTRQPRPWQRQLRAESFVHGLLECQSTQCKLECHGQWKKWNRDLTAVCNFRRIWDAYLNGREQPNDLKVQPRKLKQRW